MLGLLLGSLAAINEQLNTTGVLEHDIVVVQTWAARGGAMAVQLGFGRRSRMVQNRLRMPFC